MIIQLLSELKRLGSMIIFANFSSIVLCTKKQNVEDTLSYMEYISNSIVSKDIFHSMVLTVRKVQILLMSMFVKTCYSINNVPIIKSFGKLII